MDGLTKILSKIQSDANEQCELILKKANEQASDILREAKEEAEKQCSEITEKAAAQAKLISEKADSSCELLQKRTLLEAKGEIIKNVTENAIVYLCTLSVEEYFENIKTLALSNALSGEGKMFFNKTDYDRIPDGFEESLNKLLPNGKTVVVADEQITCRGGFVLSYPEMRVDCTFESLIEDATEEIKDKLNQVLFS